MKSKAMHYTLPPVCGVKRCRNLKLTYLWNKLETELTCFINGSSNPRGFSKQVEYENQFKEKTDDMVLALVRGLGDCHIDAIMIPPTRRAYIVDFMDAFVAHYPHARDITGCIRKKDPALRCGRDIGLSADDMLNNFEYNGSAELEHIKNLVILDDVVKHGRTLAALIALLRKKGLASDCRIQAASLLCFAGNA